MNKLLENPGSSSHSFPQSSQRPVTSVLLGVFLVAFCLQTTRGDEVGTVQGFTEPVESIDVAAMEAGSISEVLIRRGQRVRKGEVIVRLNDEVLRESRAAVEAEATSVANIEALDIEREVKQGRYETLKRLHEAGSGSQEEVKMAKADFEVASKKVEAAKEQLGIAKLRLRELDARIAQRRILSPIDGIVVDVKKKRGEYVAAEELHVATVVRLEELRAVFFVPTEMATEMNVQEGRRFKVHIPLIRRDVDSRLEYVAPVTEPDSGLVRVHLLIANERETYRSGVRCQLKRTAPSRSAVAKKKPDSEEWVASVRSRTFVTKSDSNGPPTASGY